MKDDRFYCPSLRLVGFLLLKGANLEKIIDEKGRYTFVFSDYKLCNAIKQEYNKLKG